MEGKWCEDRETATTATRSARGHRKVQRAMVQMPPQAPEGTCSALNLRLPPPEPRDQKRAVHASRLWCSVTAAPDSEQVGMGVTVWGKWAFQGLGGGGPWAVPKPCPPTVTVQACGQARLLLSLPPRPPPAEVYGHLQDRGLGCTWQPWQGNRGRAAASGQGGVAPSWPGPPAGGSRPCGRPLGQALALCLLSG